MTNNVVRKWQNTAAIIDLNTPLQQIFKSNQIGVEKNDGYYIFNKENTWIFCKTKGCLKTVFSPTTAPNTKKATTGKRYRKNAISKRKVRTKNKTNWKHALLPLPPKLKKTSCATLCWQPPTRSPC